MKCNQLVELGTLCKQLEQTLDFLRMTGEEDLTAVGLDQELADYLNERIETALDPLEDVYAELTARLDKELFAADNQ